MKDAAAVDEVMGECERCGEFEPIECRAGEWACHFCLTHTQSRTSMGIVRAASKPNTANDFELFAEQFEQFLLRGKV